MKLIWKILIILAIAALIGAIICTLFQIEPIYTFTSGLTSAILAFDFTKVSTILTGLIGGLTASITAAVAGIYKYFKTNSALGASRLQAQKAQGQADGLFTQNQALAKANETQETALTKASQEKQVLQQKLTNAQTLADQKVDEAKTALIQKQAIQENSLKVEALQKSSEFQEWMKTQIVVK